MVKRTRKEFREYNAYHDRPFGLKWGTAYAMDELVTGIHANRREALKNNPALPEMARAEIDAVLLEAFLYRYPVTVQLHVKDQLGRYLDNLDGFFDGLADEAGFWLDDRAIAWEDVRHVAVVDYEKWFVVHLENAKRHLAGKAVDPDEAMEGRRQGQPAKHSAGPEFVYEKDEYYQPFPEELLADRGLGEEEQHDE